MFECTSTDKERQQDEILALSNILNSNEFSYNKGSTDQCNFNVFPILSKGQIEIVFNCDGAENNEGQSNNIFVKHLPPIRLQVYIPNDYPSKKPPAFHLTISWLPPWEISQVCQKLDEIWDKNKGNEILFIWLEFLKNDVFSFLGINDTLDVSFMYMVYMIPEDYLRTNFILLSDTRASNRALFLHPVTFLTNYCKQQYKVDFEQKFYDCCICYQEHAGQNCIELEYCGHVFCKECTQQHITTKIAEGTIKNIKCPDTTCSCEITADEIKNLCPNIAFKYEKLLLQITLDTMNDIIHCPRKSCQHPVLKDVDDTLTICDKCYYTFCSYCYKVYHGVAPCEMAASDTAKLIKDYQNGDKMQKKLLEKRYGRKQIQLIVETHLSNEYIKDNAKSCPNCGTFITKTDGCNKMRCIHCQASFCWLCGMHITMPNAYDHFVTNGSTCYGRLFESTDEGYFNDINVEGNLLWFNEQ